MERLSIREASSIDFKTTDGVSLTYKSINTIYLAKHQDSLNRAGTEKDMRMKRTSKVKKKTKKNLFSISAPFLPKGPALLNGSRRGDRSLLGMPGFPQGSLSRILNL